MLAVMWDRERVDWHMGGTEFGEWWISSEICSTARMLLIWRLGTHVGLPALSADVNLFVFPFVFDVVIDFQSSGAEVNVVLFSQ